MPEQEALSLRFKDKDLESQFHESYDKGVRLPLRYGMLISILAWVASIVLVSFVIPDQFVHLITLTSSIILSVFVLIAYTTYNKAFGGYYHILGAFSNAWAGLFAIYFCHQFPTGENLTLPVLIFIIFFGSYMIRLRWIAGCVAALTYTIGYHVYIALYTDLSSDQVIQYAFVAWLTLLFAILAGRVAEYNNRVSFVQRKTIREQGVIIEEEKEASEKLLANMLPPFIAKRLKEDQAVIADNHNDASVLFADLVGFTELSSKLPARKLVDILNHIFSKFDALTERHELEKIKTIGDGYMVAGGLTKNKVDHLTRMASLSLEMIEFLKSDTHIKELNLKIRIGINSGNVIAGVIGIKKYTYDLWGDTVNTASRMESQGEIGRVHVSEVVKLRLDSNFDFEKRDIIKIKGKGDAQTYFLLGKK
jgi:class 3 adenylate cyclase